MIQFDCIISLQNLTIIYVRRRRIIIDVPRVHLYIIILIYYNAMDWISVGWIVEARPLDSCHIQSQSFFHLLDTIIIFYSFTAWRLYNASLNRSRIKVYLKDAETTQTSI